MSDTEASIVMIVGSNAHFIYLMRYYARMNGHQVIVAPLDGEVVTLAKQKRPAMIVLESDLAELASRDILQALKTDQATCDFPVMVCSWQDEEMNTLTQKADSYLQKPVSYEEFLVALKEVAHVSGA